jgi:hypothetical protein
VSEELDELIEMARTIRMTPEQGNPMSRKARDPSTPLRAGLWGTRGAALPTATSRSRMIHLEQD